MLIAQITDTHIRRPGERHQFLTDTAAHLRRAVERLNALDPQPEVIIHSGDLADRGRPAQYAYARSLLAPLRAPLYIIPGNHDNARELERAFPDAIGAVRARNSLSYVVDDFPVRIIGLDSTSPTWSGALFDAERLAWLARTLRAEPERPTFLFTHHPPLRTGMHYLDIFGIRGGQEFAQIVGANLQIVRIACGHIHVGVDFPWSGTTVTASASTATQYVPELFMRRRIGISRERPGFLLYRYDGVTLTTERIATA